MLAEPAAYTVDTTKLFMKEISRYKLITLQEEIELAALISAGSLSARNKLITANLRLVLKIAHDYKGCYTPLNELISYGIQGLMRAAEKFDPSFGSKFSSYAAFWIKQGMRRSIAENKLVKIPVTTATKVAKIQIAMKDLAFELRRQPTDIEIAIKIDLTEATVKKLKYTGNITYSLDAPLGNDSDDADGFNFISEDLHLPVDLIIKREFHECLNGLIEKLKPREKNIIILRFGLRGSEPQTLHQISEIIDRSRERVRQIERDALRQLKKWYIAMN